MKVTITRLLPLVSIAALAGCVSTEYIQTTRLEVTQESTKDGAHAVAVKKKIEQAELNVIEQSTNVKAVSKITPYTAKDHEKVTIGRFDLSPDGSRIVMSVLRESGTSFNSQLWGMGGNGGASTKITDGNYRDMDPTYSHDGKHIYFATNRGDTRFKLWRIQSSGTGGLTKITSGSTIDRFPSVSSISDGDIAYQSLMDGDNRWQVWSSEINGALPTQMTTGESPVYSPDGTKIIFLKAEDGTSNRHLWVMDADGSNLTQLIEGKSDESSAVWASNNKQILYSSNSGLDKHGKANYDVYLMNADGTGRTQLTTNGSVDIQPIMDANAGRIYFLSNRGGAWNIWRMDIATSAKD